MMMVDQVQQREIEQVAWITGNGIEIPEHGSGSEFSFEQRISKESMRMNKINNRTMNKLNERLITNKRAQINK
jgi:hypothetical protein